MKRQEFVGLGLVVALVSWAGIGIQAQAAPQDAKAKTTSVTGCLAKGADATSYTLSATAVSGTSQANDTNCSTMRVRLKGGNVQYGGGTGSSDPLTDPHRCWSR